VISSETGVRIFGHDKDFNDFKASDLEDYLATSDGFAEFRAFCVSQSSQENVDFYHEIKAKYQKNHFLFDNDGKRIFDTYNPQSPPHRLTSRAHTHPRAIDRGTVTSDLNYTPLNAAPRF
jgi:hypothetical protein